MAEVTGIFGSEQIELNNAATEATLKQLLAATLLMATKTGKGSDANKEIEAMAKALASGEKEAKKLTKSQKEQADQLKKSAAVQKAYDESQARAAKITVMAATGVERFAGATVAAANKLTAMVSSVANMGNSFSGAAGVLGQIPLVGGLIGPIFSAIGAAGDKVFTSFQQAASVGANFNGSIRTMVTAASDAGLTIDQFTGVIAKNGESLAMLGAGTADGAKRLANLGKIINKSPLGDDLARLGYSTEQISSSMAGFAGRLAKGGALRGMTDTQLASVSGQYLKNLDAVSKLTGQSKDSLEAQAAARMNDAQYLQLKNKLDAKGQANLESLMQSIPVGLQAGAKEVLATGTATTQAGRDYLAFMGSSGRELQVLGSTVRRTGTMTEQQFTKTAGVLQAEGKKVNESSLGNTLGLFNTSVNGMMVGASEYAGQTTTAAKLVAERNKDLADAAKNKVKDPTDPAALQKAQQELAKESNNMTLLLAEHMPTLVKAFRQLMEIINDYVKPAFNFIAKNINEIALGLALVTGGMILFKGMLKVKEGLDIIRGERGSSSLNPMHVTMDGGGGIMDMLPGGDKGGKGGKGSKRSSSKGGKGGKGLTDLAGVPSGLGGMLEGLAKGIMAFANPAVVAGAAGLALSITLVGAGVAGAMILIGAALPSMAAGMKSFEELDGKKLIDTGLGMLSIAAGVAAFGAASVISGVGGLVGGLFQALGGKLGLDGPMKQLEEFSKHKIEADKVKNNADALVVFSAAMAAAGSGSAASGLGVLVGGLFQALGGKMGLDGPMKQLEEFSKYQIVAADVKRNADALVAFSAAMAAAGDSNPGVLSSIGNSIAGFFGTEKGLPYDEITKFSSYTFDTAKIKSNAEAMVAFNQALSASAGAQAASNPGVLASIGNRISKFFGAKTPFEQVKEFGDLNLNAAGVTKNAKAITEMYTALGMMSASKSPKNVTIPKKSNNKTGSVLPVSASDKATTAKTLDTSKPVMHPNADQAPKVPVTKGFDLFANIKKSLAPTAEQTARRGVKAKPVETYEINGRIATKEQYQDFIKKNPQLADLMKEGNATALVKAKPLKVEVPKALPVAKPKPLKVEVPKALPVAKPKPLAVEVPKAATAIPKSPTVSADLSTAQKDMMKTMDDKNKAMSASMAKKIDPTAETAKEVAAIGTTNKPLTGQETPEQLLSSLNTKLDQLIKVSKSNFDVATRQLSVQRGLGGNLNYSA